MVLESFIIVLRETLEAALIVGIILSYLHKIQQTQYNKLVYAGTAAGAVGSIIAGIIFMKVAGGFEGAAEALFEGVAMLTAAVLISFMILWMIKQKHHIKAETEKRVQVSIDRGEKFELFLLPFVAVIREGIETVIFLGAISFAGATNIILGAGGGMAVAIVLGYLIFVAAKRINLKLFFGITSIFLILLAAGLTAHGVHELQEAGVIPFLTWELWNTNHWLDEKGVLGGLLATLFGYNGNPSALEVIVYGLYVVLIGTLWKKISSTKGSAAGIKEMGAGKA